MPEERDVHIHQVNIVGDGNVIGDHSAAIVTKTVKQTLAALGRADLRDHLQVLVVIAAPVAWPDPKGRPAPEPLNVKVEWKHLAEAVGRVQAPIALVRLMPPTHRALRYALGPQAREQGLIPDVVHFIGHGWEQGLLFEDDLGRADPVPTEELLACFRAAGVPLLVCNACQTAAGAQAAARALAEAKCVRAAIGHQRPAGDPQAIAFATELYNELCAGYPLREAFDKAAPHAAGSLPQLFGDGSLDLRRKGRPLSRQERILDGRPPGSLPELAPRFFGRGEELVQLTAWLHETETRVVALTGIGGIGKSALAQETAHRLGHRFPGGATWVDARSDFTLEGGLAALCASLDLSRAPDQSPGQLLYAHAARSPTLLIFDNLENVAKDDPHTLHALSDFLRGLPPASKALVTLRPPWLELAEMPGTHALSLQRGLDEEAGERLVLALAEEKGVSKLCDPGPARELTQRVSGHPKMIEVAVGTAATRGYRRLEKFLPTLSGDLGERLDEMLGWSVELLQEAGKRVLPHLRLFPAASFHAEALAAACGDEELALQGLDELVDSGLVSYLPAGERHTLHQTVLEWVEQHAPLPDESAARRRLAEYYQNFTAECCQDYDAVETERGNILGVLDYLNDQWQRTRDEAIGGLLIELVLYLKDFWGVRGYWSEGKNWLRQGQKIARIIGDEKRTANLIHELAVLLQATGDYGEARRLYQESRQIKERLGDQRGLAATLRCLGMLAQDTGKYDEARRLYQECREIWERLGDQRGLAATLHELGRLAQATGDYGEARRLYQECREIWERLGDQQGLAATLHQMATLETALGNLKEAEQLLQQSLAIYEALNATVDIAQELASLGRLCCKWGDLTDAVKYYTDAVEYYRQSLAIAEQAGVEEALARTGWPIREWLQQAKAMLDAQGSGGACPRRKRRPPGPPLQGGNLTSSALCGIKSPPP